jgi:AmiR/NasT family two-component response regulator
LIEKTEEQRPDLLIVKEELPDMRGLKAASDASKGEAIPTIVLVDGSDGELADCPESANVLAVLAEPVRQADLVPVVPLVMQRFRQFEDLRGE